MIRRAGAADLPAITDVRTSVRENHLSVEQMAARGITEASTAVAMLSGQLSAWVVDTEGSIVAFAMVEPTTGKLFALFCKPEHAGRGYGSLLLGTAEDWLRCQGARSVTLDTGEHTAAVSFYEKRGYSIIARKDGDVLMGKPLA